jgi:hypothetical protein
MRARTSLFPRAAAIASIGLLAACGAGGGDYGGGGAVSTAPPAIVTQPADVTVGAGQTAMFSVVATGYMPLAYQWRRGGADIPGATQPSYALAATPADNGATFSVRVSNLYGAVTSREATLTVN